jgi:hypoxanthine phosphoribosyltransferase
MSNATKGEQPLYKEILVDEAGVDARIGEMAGTVVDRYAGRNPLFVCLLRGGAPFSAALMRKITEHDPHFHPELDYMTVRTYAQEREPRPPEIVMGPSPSTVVEGRPVVLLDDVLDTGTTADFTTRYFIEHGATSVGLIVLAQKLQARATHGQASLFGFETPGEVWLTGMGLDDAGVAREGNRWAGYIAVANDSPAAIHAPSPA